MPITLDKVVPWGRSFSEYVKMFDLREAAFQSTILDCAGGPASFNAEARQRGIPVISCDPIYCFSAQDLAQRIEETREDILAKTHENSDNFLWSDIRSIEDLAGIRAKAMKQFLADFESGLNQGRYVPAGLPALPFQGEQFHLALCSHFLFTYGNVLSLEFHLESIRELCRVAREARIFPLLESFGKGRSPHVEVIMEKLRAENYDVQIWPVPYEFQKGGNEMLVVFPTIKTFQVTASRILARRPCGS